MRIAGNRPLSEKVRALAAHPPGYAERHGLFELFCGYSDAGGEKNIQEIRKVYLLTQFFICNVPFSYPFISPIVKKKKIL